MVSGNSMANVYVQGAQGWQTRPDFDAPSSRAAQLKACLLEHEAIEHVIYRGASPGVFVIANREGALRMELVDGEDAVGPRVRLSREGKDPLGYGELPSLAGRKEIAEWSAGSAYPDAPWQIVRFFASHRAGDLAVCARHGFDLRASFEYQPHNGSHGGLHRDHMLVPALTNGRWAKDRMRTVDLFPSILTALGKPIPAGIDGEPVAIE